MECSVLRMLAYSYEAPSISAYIVLLPKHPKAPSDRRPLPVYTRPQKRVEVHSTLGSGGHGPSHTGSWSVMVRPPLATEESWSILYLVLGNRVPFHTWFWGGRGLSYTGSWGIVVHPNWILERTQCSLYTGFWGSCLSSRGVMGGHGS